jgi:hypothetical protein
MSDDNHSPRILLNQFQCLRAGGYICFGEPTQRPTTTNAGDAIDEAPLPLPTMNSRTRPVAPEEIEDRQVLPLPTSLKR